jgi:hypothetical protein
VGFPLHHFCTLFHSINGVEHHAISGGEARHHLGHLRITMSDLNLIDRRARPLSLGRVDGPVIATAKQGYNWHSQYIFGTPNDDVYDNAVTVPKTRSNKNEFNVKITVHSCFFQLSADAPRNRWIRRLLNSAEMVCDRARTSA